VRSVRPSAVLNYVAKWRMSIGGSDEHEPGVGERAFPQQTLAL
jgi:hypothetical protein